MRRFAPLSVTLLLAACATAPRTTTTTTTTAPAIPPSFHTQGDIIGLTAPELVQRFGTPALQIREGDSLKLQFRGRLCVLDAYLYPTGTAPYRVTYVDARTASLGQVDQALCIASLQAP
jgi:hypothetical protein